MLCWQRCFGAMSNVLFSASWLCLFALHFLFLIYVEINLADFSDSMLFRLLLECHIDDKLCKLLLLLVDCCQTCIEHICIL